MNAELLKKLEQRKKKMGGNDQPIVQDNKKVKIQVAHDPNRDNIKKNLQMMFGGGTKKEQPKVTKEQIPQGNKKDFNEARKLLEMQLGGNKTSNTSSGLPPPPPNLPNLPPPIGNPTLPPIFNLPPPPSSPLPDIFNLPLPPPPSLNGLDLPPPPSFDNLILPPPPSLNNDLVLPPPPSFNNTNINPPPLFPNMNPTLPPPPSLNTLIVNNIHNSTKPNLPPPPSLDLIHNNTNINNSNNNKPNLPPPPSFFDIINSSTSNNNMPNLPPPPIFNNNQHMNVPLNHNQNSNSGQNINVKIQYSNHNNNSSHQKINQPHSTFITNNYENSNKFQPSKVQQNIVVQQKKQMNPLVVKTFGNIIGGIQNKNNQQRDRKKIFDTQKKKLSFTRQLFGRDLSAYFKNNLFSNTNIATISDQTLKKRKHQYNYPSFELDKRDRDQRKLLYFNNDADVVSSYLPFTENSVNKAIVDQHRKGLKLFKKKLEVQQTKNEIKIGYNWLSDPCKLNSLKIIFDEIPISMHFEELDFTEIRKIRQKITKLIKKCQQQQQYLKCQQFTDISNKLVKMASQFYKKDLNYRRQSKEEIQRIIDYVKKS